MPILKTYRTRTLNNLSAAAIFNLEVAILVTPVLPVTSGFATRAFLVAVRLLIKDFFWMATGTLSKFWILIPDAHAISTLVTKRSAHGCLPDQAESTTCSSLEVRKPFRARIIYFLG